MNMNSFKILDQSQKVVAFLGAKAPLGIASVSKEVRK